MECRRATKWQSSFSDRPRSIRSKSMVHTAKPKDKSLNKSLQFWTRDSSRSLVKGGSDKLPPTLSNCCCCLASPVFHKKKYGQDICVCFTLGGSTKPPLDPPQKCASRVAYRSLYHSVLSLMLSYHSTVASCSGS